MRSKWLDQNGFGTYDALKRSYYRALIDSRLKPFLVEDSEKTQRLSPGEAYPLKRTHCNRSACRSMNDPPRATAGRFTFLGDVARCRGSKKREHLPAAKRCSSWPNAGNVRLGESLGPLYNCSSIYQR
jgi:hypothetical protein